MPVQMLLQFPDFDVSEPPKPKKRIQFDWEKYRKIFETTPATLHSLSRESTGNPDDPAYYTIRDHAMRNNWKKQIADEDREILEQSETIKTNIEDTESVKERQIKLAKLKQAVGASLYPKIKDALNARNLRNEKLSDVIRLLEATNQMVGQGIKEENEIRGLSQPQGTIINNEININDKLRDEIATMSWEELLKCSQN